jgi:hypothetical protein
MTLRCLDEDVDLYAEIKTAIETRRGVPIVHR